MTSKHLSLLLLALVAASGVAAQNEDIPIENDNQFPPENPIEPEDEVVEGSGYVVLEEPGTVAVETTPSALIEEVLSTDAMPQVAVVKPDDEDQSCPNPCVCHYDGGSENFVVDCSGYGITEFPSPIDPNTTTLNLQNNKLTELPKEVSLLKKLKVLNAENNLIMNLALGSVGDLPELTVLKLGNNRLIEYPMDLKNSLSLTKLEELDLGGNDMRSELKPEIFSNFITLHKLTVPTSTPELLSNLCDSLKTSLETVCTTSCNEQVYECLDALPEINDEDLLDATLPGTIPFEEENSDPAVNSVNTEETISNSGTDAYEVENNDTESRTQDGMDAASIRASFNSRVLVNTVEFNDTKEQVSKDQENKQNLESKKAGDSGTDVTVGATTSDSTNGSGGVSKSVIGMIVAGMVVIVAVITITKNWSSIKRKFSSSPRSAERGGSLAGANANGKSPEEVPLQEKDKSPV